jgi:hypothetical protein
VSIKISRSLYADKFGPTTGDRVRLADTDLISEILLGAGENANTAKSGLVSLFRWLRPLLAFCLVFVSLSSANAEGPWPWHVVRSPRLVSLYLGVPQAESDADSAVMSCVPKSATIKIHGPMNDAMRLNIVNVLKDESATVTVTLGQERKPPVYFAGFSLSYSDMDGWIYQLSANSDDPYFKTFRNTGIFVFKLGDLTVETVNEPTKAIENIGKFIDECAKPGQP